MTKNTRLTVFLLTVFLCFVKLASAQESTASRSTPVTFTQETGELVRKYRETSALPMSKRRDIFRTSSASDKSNRWRLHLGLYLVNRADLNEGQKGIILDAISLSTPEFFAAIEDTPTRKTKALEALQSLTQRALSAFPKNEAAEVFANVGGGKAEDEILKKYDDISALPIKKRKALFRNASASDKSDLWRTHLALSLVRRSELNDWQRQVILDAMSFATPQRFEMRSDNPSWKAKVGEALRLLEDRILVAFSLEDGAKIFATLGDDTASAKGVLEPVGPVLLNNVTYKQPSATSLHMEWTTSRFAPAQDMELDMPACECSTESDWCPITGRCNGAGCSQTSSGCGTLWSYPCNGAKCQQQ